MPASDLQLDLLGVVRLREDSDRVVWSSARIFEAAGLTEATALRYGSRDGQLVAVGIGGDVPVQSQPDTVVADPARVTVPKPVLGAGLDIDPDAINGDVRVAVYGGDGVLLFERPPSATVDGDLVADLREPSPLDQLPPATRSDFVAVELEGYGVSAWADEVDKSQSTVSRNVSRGRGLLAEQGVDLETLRDRYERGELE